MILKNKFWLQKVIWRKQRDKQNVKIDMNINIKIKVKMNCCCKMFLFHWPSFISLDKRLLVKELDIFFRIATEAFKPDRGERESGRERERGEREKRESSREKETVE